MPGFTHNPGSALLVWYSSAFVLKASWKYHRVSPIFARPGWEMFFPTQLLSLGRRIPTEQGQGKADTPVSNIACLLLRSISLHYIKLWNLKTALLQENAGLDMSESIL